VFQDSLFLEQVFIAQAIGALGYIIGTSSGLFKTRSKLLFFDLLAYIFVATQWFMLSAPSLAIAQLIYAYANITGRFSDRQRVFGYFSIGALPLMAVFVYLFGQGDMLYSSFVVFASAFGLLSKSRVNMVNLRATAMVGNVCWIFLNIHAGSIPGVLCCICYFTIHAYALIRHYNYAISEFLHWGPVAQLVRAVRS